MQRFTELRVWERSHNLALAIYEATGEFPTEERFGLVAQVRRAAVSVAANIAEGSKRQSNRDYGHFLNLAQGSVAEVEELVMLSRDLGLLTRETAGELLERADHIARMLATLRTRVLKAVESEPSRLTPDARRSTGREGGR